ncbi:alanine/glycine:cation symporter family protein [Inquilinus limosus]|uniref:alanine/glycine:cation symporter family protein n=1 Tax=Inquilinus limosus TaxID=171674 RepID=UPI0003FC2FCE|nr:sodium:alanine symporter family protein [Inquilinus limosus]
MGVLESIVDVGNDIVWGHVLIYLLIATGLFFTLRSGFIQFRLFGPSLATMLGSRRHRSPGDISPFQAFATGLASRVGTGNIAGVAIAITAGGPGAVFWMWATALLGMSSAFAESTLAQLFKVNHRDDTFRGGPAYYIERGLGQRWLGIVFALLLILTFGLVFNAVQANSIVAAIAGAAGDGAVSPEWIGLVLVVITAPIIFGGVRSVARVAELMVPVMAGLYLLMALYITVANIGVLPEVVATIFKSAFGLQQAAGGFAGYAVSQAMMQGIRRGLFSNEAGMGSAPNAAATATTRHPATQGLMQMLGVFIDTIIVCSCTAAIILLSGVYQPGNGMGGVQLTQAAIVSQVGDWGSVFLAVAMFLFAYSSIIGNYAYAEGNVEFIRNSRPVLLVFRLAVLAMVFFGSVQEVKLVWNMADLSMGLMAIVNLVAILLLSRWVFVLAKDYRGQLRLGAAEPVFDRKSYPELDRRLPRDVW